MGDEEPKHDGDLKRCKYNQRDMVKCANYKQHNSDKNLCFWMQRGFGSDGNMVCTWCPCFACQELRGGAKAGGSGQKKIAPYLDKG
jgi:hypothetical protein